MAIAAVTVAPRAASGQVPQSQSPPTPSAIERLGKDLLRLGKIRVNLASREISVPGVVNPVTTIEFLAAKRDALKAYESAFTLETDGITFNTALLLLGLDRPRISLRDRDPRTTDWVTTNRLDIWIETAGPPVQRIRADRVIFDRVANREVPESTWVYTGSVSADGRYLAEVEGVLIGFIHSRSSVIDRFETAGIGRYGEIVLNPTLGLKPGAPVTVIIKATGEEPKK